MADVQRTIELIFQSTDLTGGVTGRIVEDFRDLQLAVEAITQPIRSANTSFRTFANNADKLAVSLGTARREAAGIDQDFRAFNAAAEQSGQETQELVNAIDRLQTNLGQISANTDSAAKNLRQLATAANTADDALDGIDKTTVRINNSIGQAAQGFSKFSAASSQISGPLKTMAGLLIAAEAAVLSFIAKIGIDSVNAFAEFESAIVDLQKVLPDPIKNLDLAKDTIASLAIEFGQSQVTITEAATVFAQAGREAGEIFGKNGLLTQALQVTSASELDLTESTDALVRTLSGLRIGAADLPPILSALNETSNNTAASFGDLTKNFGALAPLVKFLGLEYDTAIGLITPVVESFKSQEEASRALRTIFLRLLDPTDKVLQGLNSIGITTEEYVAANGDLNTLIAEFGPAFETAEKAVRGFAASTIFGKDQAARGAAAFGEYGRASDIAADAATEMEVAVNSMASELTLAQKVTSGIASSLERETARQLEKTAVSIAQVGSAFNQFRIDLGEKLEDSVKRTNASLVELAGTLSEQLDAPALGPLKATFAEIEGVINDLIQDVIRNLPEALKQADLSGFEEGFRSLFSLLGDGELTVQDLKEIIEGAGDAFNTLQKSIIGIINALEGFLTPILALIKGFGELDEDVQKVIGGFFGFATIIGIVSPALGALSKILFGLPAAFLKSDTAAANLIKRFDLLSKAWSVGLVGAAGAAGFAVGKLADELVRLLGLGDSVADILVPDRLFEFISGEAVEGATIGTLLAEIGDAVTGFNKSIEAAVFPVRNLNGELIGTSTNIKDMQAAATEAKPVLSDAFKPLSDSLENIRNRALLAEGRFNALGQQFNALQSPIENANQQFSAIAENTDAAGTGALGALQDFVALGEGGTGAINNLSEAAENIPPLKIDAAGAEELNSTLDSLAGKFPPLGGAAEDASNRVDSAISDQITNIDKLIEKWESATGALDGWKFAAEKAATEFDVITEKSQAQIDIENRLKEARDKSVEGLSEATLAAVAAGKERSLATEGLIAETQAMSLAGQRASELADSTDGATISNKAFGESADEAALAELGVVKVIEDGVVSYKQLGDAADESGDKLKGTGDKAKQGMDKTKKAIEEAVKEAIELKTALIDLEARKFEATAEVNISQIEAASKVLTEKVKADAEVATASFESLSASIESTGEVLSDLFGAYADAETDRVQNFLQEQIRIEQKRRQELLELQRAQTEAVIDNLEARTAALQRGDALIKVEAENLTEPLEIIWLEILKQIQIKANAEGQEYLLSIAETSGFTVAEGASQAFPTNPNAQGSGGSA